MLHASALRVVRPDHPEHPDTHMAWPVGGAEGGKGRKGLARAPSARSAVGHTISGGKGARCGGADGLMRMRVSQWGRDARGAAAGGPDRGVWRGLECGLFASESPFESPGSIAACCNSELPAGCPRGVAVTSRASPVDPSDPRPAGWPARVGCRCTRPRLVAVVISTM
jgi:hypothetical protein